MADEKKNVAPQDAPPHSGPAVTDKDKAAPSKVEPPAPGADKAAPGKVINLSDIAPGAKDGKATTAPEKKAPEADQTPKRRGRPPQADKAEKGPGPRTGRPAKADKAARGKSPSPGVLDKVVCPPSSRQGNNLHFTHEISAYQPYRAGTGLYAASRQSWTSIGVRTPSPRWRRRKL